MTFESTVSHRIVSTWNNLPDWVVSTNATNTFTNRLGKFGKAKLSVISVPDCKGSETEVKCETNGYSALPLPPRLMRRRAVDR